MSLLFPHFLLLFWCMILCDARNEKEEIKENSDNNNKYCGIFWWRKTQCPQHGHEEFWR
jgi:hypothetical protein